MFEKKNTEHSNFDSSEYAESQDFARRYILCQINSNVFLRSTLRQVLYDIKKKRGKNKWLWKWWIWPLKMVNLTPITPSYGPIGPMGFYGFREVRQRECSNIADGSDSPSSGDYT